MTIEPSYFIISATNTSIQIIFFFSVVKISVNVAVIVIAESKYQTNGLSTNRLSKDKKKAKKD